MGTAQCLPAVYPEPPYDTQRSLGGPPPRIQHAYGSGEPLSVQQLDELINTGDLVLFRGTSLFSEVVRWFCWSNESHVALADRTAAGLFVFESVRNVDGVMDQLTYTRRNGVRLVGFAERCEAMFVQEQCECVEVSIVRLHATDDQRTELQRRLWAYEREVAHRDYEHSAMSIAAAQFPLLFGMNANDESSMFCSELVAAALRQCGVLPRGTVASRVTHQMLACAAETFHRRWATRGVFYAPTVEHYRLRRCPAAERPLLPLPSQHGMPQRSMAPMIIGNEMGADDEQSPRTAAMAKAVVFL